MASRSDSAGSSRPRSRRSIAHVPRSQLTSALEKENATTSISSSQPIGDRPKLAGKDKKSRSKSLGPGGLDALQDSNGNRRKSTAAFPLKSILKPTVPVSPVRNIPTFEETRRRTPARGPPHNDGTGEGRDQGKEGLLIDFDTPAQPSGSSGDDRANPFDSFNAESIRDEMAAVREREEKEQRERERKMILQQREARRKSMANRRVSFAPEATLHTWNVVEIPDDSTSSSTSNSTRRASSLANQVPQHQARPADPPSSPDLDAESDIGFSPVQYPDLEQLQNRSMSSQEMSSSPFSGSSADGSEDIGLQGSQEDLDDDDDDNSSTSGFDGESTAMSMDDMSVHSAVTARSDGSETSSSARLNEALRQAAREAGTRGIEDDDDGDMSMEIADQEITGAFQPWIKKGERQSFDWEDISARHDQENVQPGQPIADAASDNEDEDLSMEVTNAIGRILPGQRSRRQSAIRRKSTSEETIYDEQTMELTNVVGGIAQPISPAKSMGADSNADEDEEMTMEFTSVVGGVLNKPFTANDADEKDHEQAESFTPITKPRGFSEWENEEDNMDGGMDMEITGAIGGILPPAEEHTEPMDEDQTVGMEVTTAVGKILSPQTKPQTELQPEFQDMEEAEEAMEAEPDAARLNSSPLQEPARHSPAKSPASFHVAAVASESGSPSLASVRSRRTRHSLSHAASSTPTSHTPEPSPNKDPVSPPKQSAPQASGLSPSAATPSKSTDLKSASPENLSQPEPQESTSKRRSPRRKSLFGNSATGESAPLFVLQPHGKRRSSGLGIDREGLGSPKVAAMLDKRRSIGEEAPQFVPQEQPKQGVRFEDPVKLQEEVEREREEEENREDGHIPPPNLDPTANLKDMISSLTPKKNKLRGRKSLHVGAARGVLGKRPVELDIDDEDVDNTPKRLRGRGDVSPVKNIRLPAPPSKDETVGRTARSPLKLFSGSPLKMSTTPIQEPKVSSLAISPAKARLESSKSPSGVESTEEREAVVEDSGPEFEPIQLQDFLNMTNIHFMELTTTKRRHTTAPDSATKRAMRLSTESEAKSSASDFEACVTAGFCTVPMLELYQHSCRELKSYISEGRQIIRSIETETFADNPPLFREYMTAPPDIRLLMDNQFRNVKTHARLLSKATWYEWRMKLLEGLKDGLDRHVQEMKADGELLSKHETLLGGVVPALVEKHSTLEGEATTLQQLADDMENCDQDELRSAREKLAGVEAEIEEKKRRLLEMQEELKGKTDTIESGTELKAEYTAQIQEAERVKEECRGWSAKEISELKDSVRNIERQTGWSIISAKSEESPAGPTVTMSYRNQLQLTFHPASFQSDIQTTSPELKYAPTSGTKRAAPTPPLSPISLLVLKSLQNHITTTQSSTITPKQLLRFISQAWDLTLKLEEEARMLEFCGVTKLKLLEVEDTPSLRARCTLLSPITKPSTASQTKRRIDVDFAVKTRILNNPDEQTGKIGILDIQTDVLASKVYGFGSGNKAGISETEMRSILSTGLGEKTSDLQLGGGVWSTAVRKLTGAVF
ncbi:kinetochore-microtubule binding complex subunit SPC105 [Aspergillus ibericus CBS 121593]|uniref:Chromosome segregation protein Spc105 n=1 Tax=Aspergillus ibericus CBS 121593 TaxID=1448316 RepID=A0A395GR35_9EURO|nr:chromosome segregation protein Spc105 [Aspergillus ibericus CBS 121593]RAK97832.1 chromosome segregation protein Spc105 [Aspergillus ibericus CBS 121593]